MSSYDQLQPKLEHAVNEVVEEIDKKHLRPLRKKAFLAMAKCCDGGGSREAFHQCVQRAGIPEEKANQVVQYELNEFQDRLRRAAMSCQDAVKDSGVTDPDQASAAMDKCLAGVVQKHISMVPTLKKRILQTI
ncbi:hypothetical protein CTAYLR_003097 [Chrysophaeum taylorii]|uniref:Uncharacterized protein n=1 Tax=Chrysophaeum taylorii TaxID=2483200 RepID=A0AAD7XGQ8_9STRA|nr:hypothetical protein CTAYLR_003097 [Chrysophaeum taylorii]